ncbi:MAG TPA: enoyl-CoA hydratase/isomerase family protein [Polyangiales bacterium]|nr:enoyl-CoA hydratase/isomerase family protein [Polyangiales bacterium]
MSAPLSAASGVAQSTGASTQPIEWTESGGVYELRLAQPPCNELGVEMLAGLERFVSEVEASSARAVIVHSALAAGFCAGADLRGLYAGMQGREPAEYMPELREFIERIHALMQRFDRLGQTTIGALHGVCFGGGFELALVCDVLIADRTTRFGFPELRLGIIPCFGGIPRLRRELPNAVVRDLVLTGRSLSAKRAYELGLISQLVAPGASLDVARAAARQSALFELAVNRRAKAFIKPRHDEELALERELFFGMAAEPALRTALADFVGRTDAQPYLPRSSQPTEAE